MTDASVQLPVTANFINPEGDAPPGWLHPRGGGDGGSAGLHRRAGRPRPHGGAGRPGDIRAQARQMFDNLQAALQAVGASFDQVVKLTYYLVDATQLPVVREVRDQYIDTQQPPASTAVEVRRLVRDDLLIEVEAVAAIASFQPMTATA
jgi:enamine deaminase RidA (YjgF/YER057c/UK114 family)